MTNRLRAHCNSTHRAIQLGPTFKAASPRLPFQRPPCFDRSLPHHHCPRTLVRARVLLIGCARPSSQCPLVCARRRVLNCARCNFAPPRLTRAPAHVLSCSTQQLLPRPLPQVFARRPPSLSSPNNDVRGERGGETETRTGGSTTTGGRGLIEVEHVEKRRATQGRGEVNGDEGVNGYSKQHTDNTRSRLDQPTMGWMCVLRLRGED